MKFTAHTAINGVWNKYKNSEENWEKETKSVSLLENPTRQQSQQSRADYLPLAHLPSSICRNIRRRAESIVHCADIQLAQIDQYPIITMMIDNYF